MRNFIQEGKTLEYTVTADPVKSGDLVIVEDMVGVAVTNGDTDETITLNTEGVYNLVKGANTSFKQGQKVYYSSAGNLVTTAASNIYVGIAWEPSDTGDDTVNVKINS